MKLIKIDTINIEELNIYHQLRDKAFTSDNSFIADSPKVVNILLKTNIEVKSILATLEYYEEFKELILQKDIAKLYVATKEQMQGIVGHKIHHNCMLHGIRPPESSLSELGEQIIMLDNITSSENVGSIARSAAGLGVGSYLLAKQSPHPFARRALRVSMGYASRLKIHRYADIFQTIKELKKDAYKIYAAEISLDATKLSQVKPSEKWVLLMGHEGQGISKEVLEICDETVSIEMSEDVKSFNVGVAASIMMYQFVNKV
ncbi:RNA methyltransferase [Sulfurimonas sp.]|uniref:TrmH family RNA methyltransferase n=1 Tax=Sulfurimonas sp. TaxID=2022749 RepID=UPI002AB2D7D4|nr:RNA methyltransferase [Sulfurimonas sp.]